MQRVVFHEGHTQHYALFETVGLHIYQVFQLVLVQRSEVEIRMGGALDVRAKTGVHLVLEQLVVDFQMAGPLCGEVLHDQ